MIDKMISFIGGGNMATAIIGGLLSSGLSDCDHIYATAAHEATVLRLKESLALTLEQITKLLHKKQIFCSLP